MIPARVGVCSCILIASVCGLAQTLTQSTTTATRSFPVEADPKSVDEEIPQSQVRATLDRIASQYIDIRRIGLNGFKCTVGLDWRRYFDKQPGEVAADPQLATLNADKLIYTAQFGGKDSFEFENAAGRELGSKVIAQVTDAKKKDKEPAARLLMVIGRMEGVLTSVIGMWRQYAELSAIIPDTQNAHVAITRNASGYRLERAGKARLIETFDNDLRLQQSVVEFPDRKRVTITTFTAGARGLVLSEMHTYVEPVGNSSPPPDRFGAAFEYQALGGFAVPAKATFGFAGQPAYVFEFSECQANPPAEADAGH